MVGVEHTKRLVARAVDEVIDGGDLGAVEGLFALAFAQEGRAWVAPFRAAFPEVRMQTVALVGESDTVVGRLCRSGTRTGAWIGRPGTGRAFRNVREVHGLTAREGRLHDCWGLQDNDDRRRQSGLRCSRLTARSAACPVTPNAART